MSQVVQELQSVPVASPDGSVVVTVEAGRTAAVAAAGDIYYSLSYKGRILIERSAIGRFVLRNAPPLGGRWRLVRVENSSVDETYTLPWGPVKTVRNHYNEAVFHWSEWMEGAVASGRVMLLAVRVYNEGAAFRYIFPEQPGPAELQITAEMTSFRFPADYTAFIAKARDFRSYELEYPRSRLSSVEAEDKVRLPLLIRAEANIDADGRGTGRVDQREAWLAITEAELVDYAGMYLTRGEDARTLVSILSPYPDDPELRVVARLPFATPWRVIMVADTPGKLIENNTLILNLNPPCRIRDTSWIKPGLSAWHWWSGHRAEGGRFVVPNFEAEAVGEGQELGQGHGQGLDQNHEHEQDQDQVQSHGPARLAPATEVVTYEPFPGRVDNRTIRYYTDFAAAHGFAYNLIDAGWYSSEADAWAKPLELDITKQLPQIDIPEMVQYARRRGVGIWIWVHAASLERQLDEAFALYKQWGVVGVKVDSYGRDDQPFVRFISKMVEKAAEYQLMIDFHGAYKPTGLRRTWPNFLTSEAVLGLEYAKVTSKPGRPSPTHNVTIPFTRMLAGPMDYTPGWFGTIDLGFTVKGTRAHQLAMYVVYESPLQMVSDTPMAYEGQVGIDFLEHVPTTWDETRVLLGEPGEYISIARRSGADWYVGTMTNEEPRGLEIPLSFLGEGEYVAYIYEDEDPGSAQAAAHPDPASTRLRREIVNRHTVLTARLAGGGGQAVRLTPAIAKRECSTA
ncbi:MAG: glycoside hydrolase family 97 protein [Limnochordales bacterium]|nr:glycoside hydrolase family 97 protein [Limnochordales bacterium]